MRNSIASLLTLCGLLLISTAAPGAKKEPPNLAHAANLLREEGMNSSQVMETLSYLTEVIGPRLTGSPSHKRANEWTRDKLLSWGLADAHLEAFGPFGRGWSLKSFSVQLVEPQVLPLIAYPKAWSPGLEKPIVSEVVYLNATNTADLERFKGKLKGMIVLSGAVREVKPRFDPLATRMTETNLLRLANAGVETRGTYGARRETQSSASGAQRLSSLAPEGRDGTRTNNTPPRPGRDMTNNASFRAPFGARLISFLVEEGAAMLVSSSPMGDGGTVFVSSASIPALGSPGTNGPRSSLETPRAWATNAPATLPQITVSTEDYNRLVRMIQQGQRLKMAADLQVQFHEDDLMAYNTVAEIPGTDLRNEIVMVGGHLDSWHTGTGATDNAIGVAVAMEAVRLIKAAKLEPRRTIRVGLWAGEEQGLLGSKAYVTRHFGYYTNAIASNSSGRLRTPKDETIEKSQPETSSAPVRTLVRLPEYEKFCAYFNLDNGAGRIRGIHLQANEAIGPYFRKWLEPFKDLEADTVSLSNTRGTDHTSFDSIGLPGFQFIQDPLDYNTRTHHSNQDVLDRIVPEDARQAAVILASFVYNAATVEEKLPRKQLE